MIYGFVCCGPKSCLFTYGMFFSVPSILVWTLCCDVQGTNNVRGIRLFMKDIDGTQTCAASQFSSMEELHLLVLDNNPIVPDDFSRWSEVLRWLQWKSLPFTELPSQLNLPKLTVLDLTDSGNLTRLWHNDASIQVKYNFISMQVAPNYVRKLLVQVRNYFWLPLQ